MRTRVRLGGAVLALALAGAACEECDQGDTRCAGTRAEICSSGGDWELLADCAAIEGGGVWACCADAAGIYTCLPEEDCHADE